MNQIKWRIHVWVNEKNKCIYNRFQYGSVWPGYKSLYDSPNAHFKAKRLLLKAQVLIIAVCISLHVVEIQLEENIYIRFIYDFVYIYNILLRTYYIMPHNKNEN